MDFHALLAKMQQLDQAPGQEVQSEQCGMPPAQPIGMTSGMSPKPDIPPPSMSVNINAQGLDNIEDMMRLFQKVNPDMMPKTAEPVPVMAPPPGIMGIKTGLSPLKMLPDFDADNDSKVGGEMDIEIEPMDKKYRDLSQMDLDSDDDKGSQPGDLGVSLDRDGDGDHDMDDHDLEPKDDENKKEAWANEPNEQEQDIDYMVNKLAGGMNRPQKTYPKVAGGDNPMQQVAQMGEDDLRAKIRAELKSRLAEAKDSKLEEGPMDFIKKAGSAVKGAVTGAVSGAKKAIAQPAGRSTGVSPAQARVTASPTAGGAKHGLAPQTVKSNPNIVKKPTAPAAGAAPAASASAPATTGDTGLKLPPNVQTGLVNLFRGMADDIESNTTNYRNLKDISDEVTYFMKGISKELSKGNTGAK